MLLFSVCKFLLLPLVSGVHLQYGSLGPMAPRLLPDSEPTWKGNLLLGKGAATESPPRVRPAASWNSTAVPTFSRKITTVDDGELSLVQRAGVAGAERLRVGRQQVSVFLQLAADHFQDWEASEDSDGRRRLSGRAQIVAESSPATGGLDERLTSLLNQAIPPDAVIEVEATASGGGATKRRRLIRDDVLGYGGFNIVVAARLLRQDIFSRVLRGFRRCVGAGTCFGRPSTEGEGGSRTETGSPTQQVGESSQTTTSTSVALRVAYTVPRWYPVLTEEDARLAISIRAKMQDIRSLLPAGVSREQLIDKYGFVVPLFSGSIRGKPALLARDELTSIVNHLEAVPLMVSDLYHIKAEAHKNTLQFVLKRIIQLGANLAAAGVVHADIKMMNILVDRTGQLFLSDFDSARKTGDQVACGALPASVFYDPPTAACILQNPKKRVVLSPALDAWSFGVLFFGVACRKYPFPGLNSSTSKEEKLRVLASLSTAVQQPASFHGSGDLGPVDWGGCEHTPENLRKVVEMMLDPNPATRLDLLDFFMNSKFFAGGRSRHPSPPLSTLQTEGTTTL